jgi:regulator of replication initiation timing
VGTIVTGKYAVLELLTELHDLRGENRKLRRRVAALEAGRARWRAEARAWKWGALRCRPRKSA